VQRDDHAVLVSLLPLIMMLHANCAAAQKLNAMMSSFAPSEPPSGLPAEIQDIPYEEGSNEEGSNEEGYNNTIPIPSLRSNLLIFRMQTLLGVIPPASPYCQAFL
jgi:hypothetical protein